MEEIVPLFDAPGASKRQDTEELSPTDLSNSQQFEILALLRKKKQQQERSMNDDSD